SITTFDFLQLMEQTLPGLAAKVNAQAWLHGEGVPPGAPQPRSSRLDQVRALAGRVPPEEQARSWKPMEWVLYLDATEHPASPDLIAELDRRFQLTRSGNYE